MIFEKYKQLFISHHLGNVRTMKLKRLENNKIPELSLNRLQHAMKNQVELKVENGTYQFEEISCPICQHTKNEPIGEKDRYGLYYSTNICISCGMVYTSPRMNQLSYDEFYNVEYRKLYVGTEIATDTFFSRQRSKGKKIYNFLVDKNMLSGKPLYVLEVGCGAGGIINFFREQGHKVKGIDIGEEYIKYGQNKYNLDLEVGTLSDITNKEKPDLIIYSHVLEHILDVNAEIELIKQFVHKNTIVYIEVPGIKEIHKNYQSDILKYFQNAHTFHFTLNSLVNLMNKHGFELIEGNQFVMSAFKLTNKQIELRSDYNAVNKYIDKIEKNRVLYPFTFHGLKRNLKGLIIKLLDITRTRELARKMKNNFA